MPDTEYTIERVRLVYVVHEMDESWERIIRTHRVGQLAPVGYDRPEVADLRRDLAEVVALEVAQRTLDRDERRALGEVGRSCRIADTAEDMWRLSVIQSIHRLRGGLVGRYVVVDPGGATWSVEVTQGTRTTTTAGCMPAVIEARPAGSDEEEQP